MARSRFLRRVAAVARRVLRRSQLHTQESDSDLLSNTPLQSPVPWWTERLWAGYTDYALDGLRALTVDPDVRASVRANAFLQIGRWYLARGEFEPALEHAVLSRVASGNMRPQREQPALEIDALVALDRLNDASDVLDRSLVRQFDADLALRQANTSRDPDVWLATLNEMLSGGDVTPVSFDGPASLAALRATAPPVDEGSLVSVIMPAYNAAATIATAIRSVLDQSWRSIELIVIDDGSTDGTGDVIERLASTDDRITALRQDLNRGAYAARNRGLDVASGAFVTVHDADDWSHPLKIERQLRPLLTDTKLVGTVSDWVRVDVDMRFVWSMRPSTKLIHRNYSSLLIRRALFDELGAWDEVRGLADVEFFERIEAVHGSDAVLTCLPGVPLALARKDSSSLTGGSTLAAHTRMEVTGTRRLYAEAFRWWHRSDQLKDALPCRPDAPRPFPISDLLRPDATQATSSTHGARHSDVLIVGDLSADGRVVRHLDELRKWIAGRSVAVLDLPDADGNLTPIAADIIDFMQAVHASFVAGGQAHACDEAIVVGISGIARLPHLLPEIKSCATTVVVDKAVDGDMQDNARHLFGDAVAWCPIDESVRQLMAGSAAQPRLTLHSWT